MNDYTAQGLRHQIAALQAQLDVLEPPVERASCYRIIGHDKSQLFLTMAHLLSHAKHHTYDYDNECFPPAQIHKYEMTHVATVPLATFLVEVPNRKKRVTCAQVFDTLASQE